VDVFNALLRVTGPPDKRSSNSSSSGGSSATVGRSGGSSDVSGSADGVVAAAAAASGSNTGARAPHLQQQQQQHRVSLAQSLRAFARAAAADTPSDAPSGRTPSMPAPAAASPPAGAQQQQQQQQAAMQAELEAQLQQQMAQARQQQQQQQQQRSDGDVGSASWDLPPTAWQQEQQQQGPDFDHQQQQQQQQQSPRRPSTQLLLPLSAPIGPDTAAWNALVAALVRAGQLDDAAAALERSTQASAAAGACRPPVEGYSALIRGYRRSGLKHKAVGLLRQFLNLGGRPGRVMCDDVITLCLEARDVKTARQVVRAMELTGCLDADGSAFYDGWFQRWELQQQLQLLPRHLQQSAAGAGSRGAAGARPGSSSGSSQLPAAVPGSSGARPPVAVERLKWWLGLPNSYYRGEGEAQAGAGGAGGEPPLSSTTENSSSRDGRHQQE
jgi:hypothetical protein